MPNVSYNNKMNANYIFAWNSLSPCGDLFSRFLETPAAVF